MRILVVILLFSGIAAPLHADEKGIMERQAEEAQNLLEKTFARMNHAWTRMKYHFHAGSEKVREEAEKSMKGGYGRKASDTKKAAKGTEK